MNIFKKIISIFFLYYFLACAAVQSPSGGPKDEEPPKVIEVIPPDKSINFSVKNIEIIFSEYLDEPSIYKSVQIFPKPLNPPIINLKGSRLFIELIDSLIKNQTYIVSINRNLTDEHKVKIEKGLQFAFSTGNKIDKRFISGKIFHTDIAAVELWKVNKDDNGLDNFFNHSPDYVVDASDNGDFKFNFLSKGHYKIVAVDKSISGLPIILDKMFYGLSSTYSLNLETLDSIKNIQIKIPQNVDGIKMNKAESVLGGWVRLNFSRPVKNWENILSILVFDDDSLLLSPEFFEDPRDDFILNFNIKDLKSEYINIRTSKINGEESIKVDSSQIRLKMKDQLDFSNISLVAPTSKYIHQVELDSILPLEIIFSSLILSDYNNEKLILKKDSINIPININWNSYLSVSVTPENNWDEESIYELIIEDNFFKPVYGLGLKDSIKNLKFKTSNYNKFGNFFGNVDKFLDDNMIIEISSMNNISEKFQTIVNLDSSFKILKVPEGDYSLSIYIDNDENKKYTYGTLEPYKPSEWFQNYSDTIKIRGNWDIELENIKINNIR